MGLLNVDTKKFYETYTDWAEGLDNVEAECRDQLVFLSLQARHGYRDAMYKIKEISKLGSEEINKAWKEHKKAQKE